MKLHLTLALLLASISIYRTHSQTAEPPNIVFILCDDLGWKDVGYNGSQFYETPNIDRLAETGMVFTNAYANAPVCGPSRAALLSGQYAARTGFFTNGDPARGESSWRAVIPTPSNNTLARHHITMAEALKPAGYTTAYVGKWHLGDPPEKGPRQQGFDLNIGGHRSGKPKSYFSPYQNPYLEDGPPGEYLTDRLTEEGIQFIKDHKEDPFFLFLGYHTPHTPIQAKDPYIWHFIPKPASHGQYDPVYAAMLKSLDENVGRLMETLQQLKLEEKTMIVFFSDNGGLNAVTSNDPLRMDKGSLYEGGIRVPMIVRWPGQITPGTYCHEPVCGIDFYPTFLELARTDPLQNYPLDGKSLLSLMKQKGGFQREAIYWHFPAYLQGAYGMYKVWRTTPVSIVRSGRYKLHEFLEDGHFELYDLSTDITEQHNLAQEFPGKVQELYQLLSQWRTRMGLAQSLDKNPDFDPATLPLNTIHGKREWIYTYSH